MVIIKLKGGLGNQMFQYAAARGLTNETVYIDQSFFKQNGKTTDSFTARKYALEIFKNLKAKKLNDTFARVLSHSGRFSLLKNLFPKRWKNFTIITGNESFELNYLKNYLIDGYFQREDYFEKIQSNIRAEFSFPKLTAQTHKISEEIKNKPNAVSIHVRRGDYLKPSIAKHHPVLDLFYYKKAIECLEKKIDHPFFYIISDDLDWCESNFGFLGENFCVLRETEQDWEAMYLMSICKHNIIANSSFSWWGAWLNKNPQKTVFAPQKWFPTLPNPASKTWIKI